MQPKPKLQVTGYRGIWGESLTEDIIRGYTGAFAQFTKEDVKRESPTILIGRDGRESGPEIKKIVIEELEKAKVNIIDGDIMPSPTVMFAVRKHSYDGAIIITASHNPSEYNGLKFVTNKSLLTNETQVEVMKRYYEHP